MTIIWWLYIEVEKGEVNALPIVMPNTKTEEPGYARAWNMQHFSICTHSIPIHYKTELIIIPLLHMEPPLLCWISYLQVLPQWKLSQSLPQLPKVRVQEDRLILQTTRNEGDWYKHWAWHCVYCMCTWELFVQNFRWCHVHTCAHLCSAMAASTAGKINFPLLQCFNSLSYK